jgi:uncharacterized membrane protein
MVEEGIMELSGRAALVAATMSVGLMAGVFGSYANSVMPGLGRTDDRTFVGAFQAIDRAIINPVFMAAFLGALVLTGLAVVLHLGQDSRPVLTWAMAALVLYLVAFVVTIAVHVPLNDQIKAAGDPARIADWGRCASASTRPGGCVGTCCARWSPRPPSAAWPGRWS